MNLGDRIRLKRKELKLTQSELAEKVGFKTKGAISRVENGTRDLTQNQIMDFARALHSTPSYLMGWDEEQANQDRKDVENKEVFSKNLLSLMEKHGVSRNKLCDDLGLKYMTVSDWINAKTYPRINKIEMLADYFHVNKSDIIEEKNPSKKNTEDTVIYKDDDFKVFSPTRTVSPAYKPVFGNQLLAMTTPVKEECPEEEEERRPSREEMLDWLKNNIRTAAYGGGNYEEITDDEELYQYYQDVRSEFDEE